MPTRAEQLNDRAQRCRELADSAMTDEGRSILFEIARRYEQEASGDDPTKQAALPESVC